MAQTIGSGKNTKNLHRLLGVGSGKASQDFWKINTLAAFYSTHCAGGQVLELWQHGAVVFVLLRFLRRLAAASRRDVLPVVC